MNYVIDRDFYCYSYNNNQIRIEYTNLIPLTSSQKNNTIFGRLSVLTSWFLFLISSLHPSSSSSLCHFWCSWLASEIGSNISKHMAVTVKKTFIIMSCLLVCFDIWWQNGVVNYNYWQVLMWIKWNVKPTTA